MVITGGCMQTWFGVTTISLHLPGFIGRKPCIPGSLFQPSSQANRSDQSLSDFSDLLLMENVLSACCRHGGCLSLWWGSVNPLPHPEWPEGLPHWLVQGLFLSWRVRKVIYLCWKECKSCSKVVHRFILDPIESLKILMVIPVFEKCYQIWRKLILFPYALVCWGKTSAWFEMGTSTLVFLFKRVSIFQ